jgi:hypothetical protein
MKLRGMLATSASIILPAFGALAVALLAVSPAQGQCAGYRGSPIQPSAWHPQSGQPRLLLASLGGPAGQANLDDGNVQPIVGMWHIRFVSNGVSSGIPGGVPKGAPTRATPFGTATELKSPTPALTHRTPATSAWALGPRWGRASTGSTI